MTSIYLYLKYFVLILLIDLLLVKPILVFAKPALLTTSSIFSNAVLIVTDNPKNIISLLKMLPEKNKVIDQYQNRLIVEFTLLNKSVLQKLNHLPGVSEVKMGLRLSYLLDPFCEKPESAFALSPGLIEELNCLGAQFCNPSGRSRLWAQDALATDLAQQFLLAKKVPRTTRIAVIDSGFNTKLSKHIAASENLKVEPALTSSFDYDKDLVGHGTRVVSLIKGADGIGGSTASPVKVYGFAKANIANVALENTILRACNDGNQIINVSMGLDFAMFQFSLFSTFSKETIKVISEKGCLIVHASGNSGGIISFKNSSPFELQIGATDPKGNTAGFSSVSQFQVPGQSVIGLSSEAEGHNDSADACNQTVQSFSSGTSFAAPLFASHLTLVRDVLATSDVFLAQSNVKQAKMLDEISRLSIVGKNVNSYLAVRIAEAWTKNPKKTFSETKAILKNQLNKNCNEDPEECRSEQRACIQKNQCRDKRREAAIICQDLAFNQESQLVASLQNEGDLEGADYWRQIMASQFPERKASLAFPLARMKAELSNPSISEKLSQSKLARWLGYYDGWQQQATSASPEAHEYLTRLGKASIMDLESLKGRENSLVAHNDSVQLFISMKKSGLLPPETVFDWVNKFRKEDKKYNSFYVEALVKAERQGLVSKAEMSEVVMQLSNSDAKPADLDSAVKLLKHSNLIELSEKIKLADVIMGHSSVSDKTMEQIVDIKMASANAEQWVQIAADISASPNLGPNSADAILTRLWLEEDKLVVKNKKLLRGLIAKLASIPHRDNLSDAMIEIINKRYNK